MYIVHTVQCTVMQKMPNTETIANQMYIWNFSYADLVEGKNDPPQKIRQTYFAPQS